MKNKKTLAITESAVMLALGFILSMIKIVDMPYGGAVTAFSMLPVIIIAYRYRTAWGLITGLAYSLLQLLLGLGSLSYATSAAAAVAIILLDFIAAFVVLGLGGVFRDKIKGQGAALAMGSLVACLLRYLCHVIAGCTVWAGVSVPTAGGLIYSLGYNATYMIPETVLTVVGAYFAGRIFTLTDERIARRPAESGSLSGVITALPLSVAAVICCAVIFGMMQNPDDGSFDITLVSKADFSAWIPVIIIAAVGAVVSAAVGAYYKSAKKKAE